MHLLLMITKNFLIELGLVTILLMLFVVLYDSFIVFLLQILCSSWFWGKHSLMILRKVAPTLVFTFSAYGGLNHVILLFLFLLLLLFTILAFWSYFSVNLCPLSSSAFLYGCVEALKMSSFAEFLESLLLMFVCFWLLQEDGLNWCWCTLWCC